MFRWEVDREGKIGMGFFSDVYKGKWRDREVAIKVRVSRCNRKCFHLKCICRSWHQQHHVNSSVVRFLFGRLSSIHTFLNCWVHLVLPVIRPGSLSARI